MKKILFFAVTSVLGLVGVILAADKSPGTGGKPNILFILTDDQGYGDLGRHGHPLLKTPQLDRLYDQSVRLSRFYVSASCAPTRAALMTGRHEFRNGVTHTTPPREHLNLETRILPQWLQSAGYATALIGKWHLGHRPGFGPQERGFDFTYSSLGGVKEHFDCVMTRNGQKVATTGYREDRFTDEAIDFMQANREKPFFCYLATFSPHAPLAAPEEFIAPYRGRVSDEQATFLGMVANLDYNVGRLLAFLDRSGLAENTIVVFMNDNGATEGLDVFNAGMRGCKTTPWEGGSRAMSLWRWPSRWAPRTETALSAHVDVLPTLCELAGVAVPPQVKAQLDGFSLVPLLDSPEGAFPRDRLLFLHPGRWVSGTALEHKDALGSVRQGDWLLVQAHGCADPACMQPKSGSVCAAMQRVARGATQATYTRENAAYHWGSSEPGRWSLYHLGDDPESRHDVAARHPEVVARLGAAYDAWWDSLLPGLLLNEPEARGRVAR